jgi:hypothetical protein
LNISYLKIIVADGLFIKVSDLEPSATLEGLGLNDLLNLGRSVWDSKLTTLLSQGSTSKSSLAPKGTLSDGAEESILSLVTATVKWSIVPELWKSECESLG